MEMGKTFIIIMHYACIHVFGIKNRVEHNVSAFQRFFIGLNQGCKIYHDKTQIHFIHNWVNSSIDYKSDNNHSFNAG